jgi:hypothetical protein
VIGAVASNSSSIPSASTKSLRFSGSANHGVKCRASSYEKSRREMGSRRPGAVHQPRAARFRVGRMRLLDGSRLRIVRGPLRVAGGLRRGVR